MNLSKTKFNLYSRLSNRKQREKQGLFIAEGVKCVEDTLPFFEVEAIIVLESFSIQTISPKLVNCLSKMFAVGEAEMRQISQLQTLPEIIAIYKIPESATIDETSIISSLTLLLDGIQDPGNIGTIIRIASWFGIGQVILGKGCADPYNPKAVQSSMGAIGMVRIVEANLLEVIDSHPDIPLCGTLLEGDDIYSAVLPRTAMIAMGNEGNGLSKEVRSRVNLPLLIPSFAEGPHAESLNVAAATAVTVSEFRRRLI